ncbi:Apoptosis-inducing factor 2 [Hondaea fermentalgiana]|uniref:Apoptosis-inducing factor 2 n=1 Tax=Hondaea fermentalgiana TaxID=2315210 RepID=A0A2R5G2K6_9STRA|nr:Apoptosis-inducing factor 2 [Hondaea fermentalgiana]|eukprot:GBG25230.1 Apoptosis-inducing factor 2 [Hondaea fermentalgiana]
MGKKVVVLGAGYGGTGVAAALDKQAKAADLELTVVDMRENMVHKLGGLRAAVDSTWVDKILVPRDKLLRNGGQVVSDAVVSVGDADVTLASGETLPYDFLVVATGAHSNSPGEPGSDVQTAGELRNHFASNRAAIEAASKIAIIGGGVVGVELSGEIKHSFPDKEVTIIHSQDTFVSASVPPLPASFQRRIKKQMDKMGIKYVLGSKAEIDLAEFQGQVVVPGSRTIRTASGQEVETDLMILAVGTTPNSGAFPEAWRNTQGLIKVNEHLQVLDGDSAIPNVFALGDVCDVGENKMAYYTGLQVPVVVKNLLAVAAGKASPKKYSPHASSPFMVVPLGPKGGNMATPLGTFGPFLTSTVKGKGLFLDLAWGPNHVKAP